MAIPIDGSYSWTTDLTLEEEIALLRAKERARQQAELEAKRKEAEQEAAKERQRLIEMSRTQQLVRERELARQENQAQPLPAVPPALQYDPLSGTVYQPPQQRQEEEAPRPQVEPRPSTLRYDPLTSIRTTPTAPPASTLPIWSAPTTGQPDPVGWPSLSDYRLRQEAQREPTAPEVQASLREWKPGWSMQPQEEIGRPTAIPQTASGQAQTLEVAPRPTWGQMPYQQAAVTPTAPETRPEDQTPEPVAAMGPGTWLDQQVQKGLDWWNRREEEGAKLPMPPATLADLQAQVREQGIRPMGEQIAETAGKGRGETITTREWGQTLPGTVGARERYASGQQKAEEQAALPREPVSLSLPYWVAGQIGIGMYQAQPNILPAQAKRQAELAQTMREGAPGFGEVMAGRYAPPFIGDIADERLGLPSRDTWLKRMANLDAALYGAYTAPGKNITSTPVEEWRQAVLYGNVQAQPQASVPIITPIAAFGKQTNVRLNPFNPNYQPIFDVKPVAMALGIPEEQAEWLSFFNPIIGLAMVKTLPGGERMVFEDYQQNFLQPDMQAMKAYVDRSYQAPKEQKETYRLALNNAVSGPQRVETTLNQLLSREDQIAWYYNQARLAKQVGDDEAAAYFGAQWATLKATTNSDIVDQNANPWAELMEGIFADPTNLLDAAIPLMGLSIAAFRSRRLGRVAATTFEQGINNVVPVVEEGLRLANAVEVGGAPLRPPLLRRLALGTFDHTPIAKSAQGTETLLKGAAGMFQGVVDPGQAKAIWTGWIDNPKAFMDDPGVNVGFIPGRTDETGVLHTIIPGLPDVAEASPILRVVRDEMLNGRALNAKGPFNLSNFLAELDDKVFKAFQRAYGVQELGYLPEGAVGVRVRRNPDGTGTVYFVNTKGDNILERPPVPFTEARTTAKNIKNAAEGQGGLVGAGRAVGKGLQWFNNTQRAILSDMYLHMRPANWIRNAATAAFTLVADGNFGLHGFDDMMDELGNAFGWAGSGRGLGMVDETMISPDAATALGYTTKGGTHWTEFGPFKNNWLARASKGGAGVWTGKGFLGEEKFWLTGFYKAALRDYEKEMRNTFMRGLYPVLLKNGFTDDAARGVVSTLVAKGMRGRVAMLDAARNSPMLNVELGKLGIPAELLSLEERSQLADVIANAPMTGKIRTMDQVNDILDGARSRMAGKLNIAPVQVGPHQWMEGTEVQTGAGFLDDLGDMINDAAKAGMPRKDAESLLQGIQQQVQDNARIQQEGAKLVREGLAATTRDPGEAFGFAGWIWHQYEDLHQNYHAMADAFREAAINANDAVAWETAFKNVRNAYAEMGRKMDGLFNDASTKLLGSDPLPSLNPSELDLAFLRGTRVAGEPLSPLEAAEAAFGQGRTLGGVGRNQAGFKRVMGANRSLVADSNAKLFDAFRLNPTAESYDIMVDALRKQETWGAQVDAFLRAEAKRLHAQKADPTVYQQLRNDTWAQWNATVRKYNAANARAMYILNNVKDGRIVDPSLLAEADKIAKQFNLTPVTTGAEVLPPPVEQMTLGDVITWTHKDGTTEPATLIEVKVGKDDKFYVFQLESGKTRRIPGSKLGTAEPEPVTQAAPPPAATTPAAQAFAQAKQAVSTYDKARADEISRAMNVARVNPIGEEIVGESPNGTKIILIGTPDMYGKIQTPDGYVDSNLIVRITRTRTGETIWEAKPVSAAAPPPAAATPPAPAAQAVPAAPAAPNPPPLLHAEGDKLDDAVLQEVLRSHRTRGVRDASVSDVLDDSLRKLDGAEDKIRSNLDSIIAKYDQGGTLTPGQRTIVLRELQRLYPELDAIAMKAQKTGQEAADLAMLNFGNKRGIDSALSLVFPYHYFWSRTALNWARRVWRKPGIANFFYETERTKNLANEQANQGLGVPARTQGQLPFGPNRAIDLFTNMFNPFYSYSGLAFTDREQPGESDAERLLNTVQSFTPGLLPVQGMLLNRLLDKLDPLPSGPRDPVTVGDFLPLGRAGYYFAQGLNGETPNWAKGLGDEWDPYRISRALAVYPDILKKYGKTNLAYAQQMLTNQAQGRDLYYNVPEDKRDIALEIYKVGAKAAGWERFKTLASRYVTGVGVTSYGPQEMPLNSLLQQAQGLRYDPLTQPFGSKEAANRIYAENPALFNYGMKNTAISGAEVEPSQEPAARGQNSAMWEEKNKVYAEMNATVDDYLRKNPNATKAEVNELTRPFYDQLDAIEAKYPLAVAGEKSTYGMNPQERGKFELERILSFDKDTKPAYPPDGSPPEVMQKYYDDLDAWQRKQYNHISQYLTQYLANEPRYPEPWREQVAKYVRGQYLSDLLRRFGNRYDTEIRRNWEARIDLERAWTDANIQQSIGRITQTLGAQAAQNYQAYLALPKNSPERDAFKQAHPDVGASIFLSWNPKEYAQLVQLFGPDWYAQTQGKPPYPVNADGTPASEEQLQAYYAQLSQWNATHPQAEAINLWLWGRPDYNYDVQQIAKAARGDGVPDYDFGKDYNYILGIVPPEVFEWMIEQDAAPDFYAWNDANPEKNQAITAYKEWRDMFENANPQRIAKYGDRPTARDYSREFFVPTQAEAALLPPREAPKQPTWADVRALTGEQPIVPGQPGTLLPYDQETPQTQPFYDPTSGFMRAAQPLPQGSPARPPQQAPSDVPPSLTPQFGLRGGMGMVPPVPGQTPPRENMPLPTLPPLTAQTPAQQEQMRNLAMLNPGYAKAANYVGYEKGARTEAEIAARRNYVVGTWGENGMSASLWDGYFALPKDSPERRGYLAANPVMKAALLSAYNSAEFEEALQSGWTKEDILGWAAAPPWGEDEASQNKRADYWKANPKAWEFNQYLNGRPKAISEGDQGDDFSYDWGKDYNEAKTQFGPDIWAVVLAERGLPSNQRSDRYWAWNDWWYANLSKSAKASTYGAQYSRGSYSYGYGGGGGGYAGSDYVGSGAGPPKFLSPYQNRVEAKWYDTPKWGYREDNDLDALIQRIGPERLAMWRGKV